MSESVGYEVAVGSYEDAVAMIGHRSPRRHAATAVSGARIQMFAAMVRDPNPGYWDAGFADRVWGGLLGPPALLMGWLIPPRWQPGGEKPAQPLVMRIPLPGTSFINAANDAEYPEPIREGDRLSVIEEVVSVSPEKRTRLGVGHFIETLETYYREDGVVVARNRNTLFRFTPADRT